MSASAPADAISRDSIAVICGGGPFPLTVADALRRRGRRVVLFPLRGWFDPAAIGDYPHHWVGLAQLGRFRRLARSEGCRDIVIIGVVLRPRLWQLRPDWAALRLIPRLPHFFRGGDDHLLSEVGRLLEENGFRLVGAHEAVPEILVPEGMLGAHRPAARDMSDIARGLSLIAAMGPFDVGQSVVVANDHVLAVEAAEGTDHMLARIAALRREGRINLPVRTGVLVKAPKPGQDRRLDLPSIGERTVERAAAAGLAGIAVEAASAMTVDLQKLIRACDAAGLFLVGAAAPPPAERR